MKELTKNKLKRIAYNCKEATFLIEKRQIGKLTFREEFKLRFHLVGCLICRIYLRQSKTINRLVNNIIQANDQGDLTLDDHFKEDLQEKIDQHFNRI